MTYNEATPDQKRTEFVGIAVVLCGIAIFVAAVMALLEHRERAKLAEELESWQRQEWIENLIEMRRQELTNKIKNKPV